MHLKDTSNTLFFILCSIQYIRTRVHCTRVNSEVSKLTYEWVCHDLKYESRERLFIRRVSYYFVSVFINTLDCRDVCWSRHKLDDCIKEFLNTFVSVCSTAAYRNSCTLTCSFSQNCFHCIDRRFFTLKVFHHKVIVQLTDFLYEFCVIKLSFILHLFRNICYSDVFTLLIIVDVGLHLEQIDDSFEFVFFSDWKLKTNSVLSKSCLDLIYSIVEISTKDVHLIDECHTWYIVCVCLTPYVF